MKAIRERITVASPPSIALRGIERYFASKKDGLELRVPLRSLGLPSELGLERTVTVKFVPEQRDKLMLGRRHERLNLKWMPKGGGPYPAFDGTITIRPLSGQTELELRGNYKPPLGAFGAAFDALAGKKLAHATALALLAQMKGELEREYATFKETLETHP